MQELRRWNDIHCRELETRGCGKLQSAAFRNSEYTNSEYDNKSPSRKAWSVMSAPKDRASEFGVRVRRRWMMRVVAGQQMPPGYTGGKVGVQSKFVIRLDAASRDKLRDFYAGN
jgi:hypothetical protein